MSAAVYYGVQTPASRNDLPNPSALTRTTYTGAAVSFTTNAGSGQYSYFVCPVSLGTAGFRYLFPDEGSWWSGGYTFLDTLTINGVVHNAYRSTNANLGQMTTSVTFS